MFNERRRSGKSMGKEMGAERLRIKIVGRRLVTDTGVERLLKGIGEEVCGRLMMIIMKKLRRG